MEYIGNTLACTAEDLQGIIPVTTLRNLSNRGQIERLQRGGNGRKALYGVDSFPEKYRKAIYEKYPTCKESAKPLMEGVEEDAEAREYFCAYILGDGRHLSAEKIEEYTANASLLNRCREILEASASHRSRQSHRGTNKGEFWARVAEALGRIKAEKKHSLPENTRSLRRKFNEYLKGGYKVLVSGKYMNGNTKKIDSDVKESVVIQMIADRRNFDNEQIATYYNILANNMGWKEITGSCVGVWREKTDIVTYAGRRGETAFRNTKTMQCRRQRPQGAMMYWTTDGWDAELLYQKTKEDKKGHRVTTYHNRLTVVVVLDACVNYPIGYAIGEAETPELIRKALRNAVNHTAELFGQRMKVGQLQCDRYAIKNLSEDYKAVAGILTPARAHNAKAKVIEPYFNRLNKDYCQREGNWSGYGITSKRDRQVNSDALNRCRHSFPDMEGCARQIASIIEEERAKKIDRYKEMFDLLPLSQRLPLSTEEYLLHFGSVRERGGKMLTNRLEGNGIACTIGGEKKVYDCWDMNFRKYSYEDWVIKYDPEDLSCVLAQSKSGERRFMLCEKYTQPMAIADRTPEDSRQYARVIDFNKSLEAHVSQVLCGAQEATRSLLEENAGKIDATLSRLMLCDSRGQHKNRRNSQRISTEEIESVQESVKIVDFETKEQEEEEYIEDLY
jgi:hypothetical protein